MSVFSSKAYSFKSLGLDSNSSTPIRASSDSVHVAAEHLDIDPARLAASSPEAHNHVVPRIDEVLGPRVVGLNDASHSRKYRRTPS